MRFYLYDPHGDVVGLADPNGAAVGTRTYSPWGETRQATGETSALGFQGDPLDADTGLYDLGTRFYDPGLGRFSTRDVLFGDPMAPVSLNQFVYAAGDPVSNIDLDGLCAQPDVCGPTSQSASGRRKQAKIGRAAVRVQSRSASYNANSKIIQSYKPPPPVPKDPPAKPKMSTGPGWVDNPIVKWSGWSALANISAGIGDTVSLGATRSIRRSIGVDDQVDASSGMYRGGEVFGIGAGIVTGGAALKAAATAGRGAKAALTAYSCLNSFVAGTPVALANGKSKAIQDIRLGDKVVATDDVNPGSTRGRPVTGLIRHGDSDLYRLRVEGEILRATGLHPFWVEGEGWVNVEDLSDGMTLRLLDARPAELKGIEKERGTTALVYNLRVAGDPTFFVGRSRVLVHNCKVHGNSAGSPRTAHLYRLEDSATGSYLKTGISQNPFARYTHRFMENKRMTLLTSGSRREMLNLERWIVERDPGVLNRERWAGRIFHAAGGGL